MLPSNCRGQFCHVHLERLDDVVLVALEEVSVELGLLPHPLPTDCEEAPGKCWGPVTGELLIELQVMSHDVPAHVPVEGVGQQHRVCLTHVRHGN